MLTDQKASNNCTATTALNEYTAVKIYRTDTFMFINKYMQQRENAISILIHTEKICIVTNSKTVFQQKKH